MLDVWPGGVGGGLHPVSAYRSSLGEAVWNTVGLHHVHWLGVCAVYNVELGHDTIAKWIIMSDIYSSRCSHLLLFCAFSFRSGLTLVNMP